jgi:hypothetical protein
VTRALAARCLALLGPLDGRIAVVGPRAARVTAALPPGTPLAGGDEPPAAAIVTFLGARDGPTSRQASLASLRSRLAHGAPMVLVDHNQPRAWWRRVLGVVALAIRGFGPARARYPAARELAALGLDVERLRLACGERVQLVVARRRGAGEPCGPAGEQVEGHERGRWR